jgi:hypothetical protein
MTRASRSAASFVRGLASAALEKVRGTSRHMKTTLSSLSDAELLDSTHRHVQRGHEVDADLLLHLVEIDARRLWAERAFSSMISFCTKELGFSEDVACNRIGAARLVQRFPRVLDFVRAGRIHLTGLRLLETHLTEANCEEVLAAAEGKSKRDIEELVARLAPKPPVPPTIRKLPARAAVAANVPAAPAGPVTETAALPLALAEQASASAPMEALPVPPSEPPLRRPTVKPLSAETFAVSFTADRALKAKLEQAEELMRHRVGRGNLVAFIERALDPLITDVKKERFGVGRRPRSNAADAEQRVAVTRHVPVAIRREVYERDEGQCAYVSEQGRRCEEKGWLELEHTAGFALTGRHAVGAMKVLCRTHNQLSAEKLYGRTFMEARRRGIRAGADNQPLLF